jgi:hypothetical protein
MVPRPRGYNHDVRYRGQVFHIQSEVCGAPRPQVRTQLFSRGAVLASERTPIDDAEDSGVEALLRRQHKSLLRELCNGTFDAWLVGARADDGERALRAPPTEVHVPVRRRGVALDIRARDCRDRHELSVEVCQGPDVIAVRRVAYDAATQDAEVESELRREVDAMIAKVRRGGLDARLAAPTFVFVPPPIPR